MTNQTCGSFELARGMAAQAWCAPATSGTEMDVKLAEEFAKILERYIEALQWCSASDDFQEFGKVRLGWLKVCAPLLSLDHDLELSAAIERLEKAGLKHGSDFTIIQEGDPNFPDQHIRNESQD